MTTLRLEPTYGNGLDRAIAAVDGVTLARREDGTYIQVSAHDVADLVRVLALGGIEVTGVAGDVVGETGAVRATSDDLRPAPRQALIVDLVQVRRVGLGEATSRALGRRLPRFRSPSAGAMVQCRELLSGDEVVLAWRRLAHAKRDQVRALRSYGLRPFVFERGAGRDRLTLMSRGAFAKWAFD